MASDMIAIIGDMGSLFARPNTVKIETPYGPPSSRIELGELGGRSVAYLSRHGRDMEYIPAHVPYRANMWALQKLGVNRVLGICTAASLQGQAPGSVVLCDQFVDQTWGRQDTFYEGPLLTHVSSFEPYCSELRAVCGEVLKGTDLDYSSAGTMVVVQGPRLPSRAERDYFRKQAWDVVTMTGYPEAILARELELCYANLSFVVAREGESPPEEVHRALERYPDLALPVLTGAVQAVPRRRACSCKHALRYAR